MGTLEEKLESLLGNSSNDNIADLDTKQILMRINLLKGDLEKKADKDYVFQVSEDLKERLDALNEEFNNHKE